MAAAGVISGTIVSRTWGCPEAPLSRIYLPGIARGERRRQQPQNGGEHGCIDLCAWSATRGAPHRPASTRISTSTPRLCPLFPDVPLCPPLAKCAAAPRSTLRGDSSNGFASCEIGTNVFCLLKTIGEMARKASVV